MGIFLDSARLEDLKRARGSGFLKGVTTNPALLAKVGAPREEILRALCQESPGPVFAQLSAEDVFSREAEAERLLSLSPQIALKIPATTENFALAARLSRQGATVGITALFDAAQGYLACEAGARYVLPYVNRSTRLQGDGYLLVRRLRQVIEACGQKTEILAASIKSPAEAVETLLAGAHHLTLPLEVFEAMGNHPLSEKAIQEFAEAEGKS